MKKAIALFLVLVLTMSSALAADGSDFLWSESEKEASEIDGAFHSFETAGLKIRIPAVLEEQNLSEEEMQAGYIGIFATQSHSVIKISCIDENVESLEEYSCRRLSSSIGSSRYARTECRASIASRIVI